jgi:predicted glycosyltransferase
LNCYGFKFIKVGKNVAGLVPKACGFFKREWKLLKIVKEFDPDFLISATSPPLTHVSKLTGKKHIGFVDTEHAVLANKLSIPFTDVICTPSCFKKNFGKKHLRYNGYQELAYLHPNHFKPNPDVLKKLNINPDEKYFIVRFVAWTAHHDIGHKGISNDMKLRIVKELKKYGRVLITSEIPLPEEFEPYKIAVSPEKMHDLMYYATLLFGESATMASECAVLGTPAIFLDFAGRGYTDDEEKEYGLVYNFKNDEISQEKALEKAIELVSNDNLKEECVLKRAKLLDEKIDVTEFMLKLIEKYSK